MHCYKSRYILGIGRKITIYDVKISRKVKDKQFLCGALANMHSLSSTTVRAEKSEGDTVAVKVQVFLHINNFIN